MQLIPLVCPSCNGNLTIESDREFCFCSYCGTRIAIEQPNVIKIKQDNTDTIKNYLLRASEFYNTKNYNRAIEYYDKVLDLDAANAEAREGLNRIIIEPNVSIKRKSHIQSAARNFKIYIDGEHYLDLADGISKSLIVPYGKHIIRAEGPGVHPCETEIDISSSKTKIDILLYVKVGFKSQLIFEVKYN